MRRLNKLPLDARALWTLRRRSLASSWRGLLSGLATLAIAVAGLVSGSDSLALAALAVLSFIAVERMALLLLADRRLHEAAALVAEGMVDIDADQLHDTQRRLMLTAVAWTAVLLGYSALVVPGHAASALALSLGALGALFRALWLPEAEREKHLAHYGTPLRPTWPEIEQAKSDLQRRLGRLRTRTAALAERTHAVEVERDEAMGEWMRAEDVAEAERRRATEQFDRLGARVSDLLERLRLANGRLPAELRVPEDGDLVDDLTAAFVRQVREAYAARFGAEADASPLAPIRLGYDFMSSLDRVRVPRRKVIDVVGEVASRKAWRMDGRQVHRLRSGTGAEAAPVIRSRDGAKAWRCALKRGTPSAPRMHWWELADGAIELAAVVGHDDFTIPE